MKMGIINKVTTSITRISIMYELAKSHGRKDITKHIKKELKKLAKEVKIMLHHEENKGN